MQTARKAVNRPAPVIHLDDFRPRITSEQLIAEAHCHRTGTGSSLEETVLLLPDFFALLLDYILSDFDYRLHKKSNIAIACRLLASSYNHFMEKIQEEMQ